MRGEVGRKVLWCIAASVISLCLPVANFAAATPARANSNSGGRTQNGWSLSVRGGVIGSADVFSDHERDTRWDNALSAGLSHWAGPKTAFEIACVLSAASRGPLRLSMAQGKFRVLLYPSARLHQRDQLFFLVGAEFLVADDEEHAGRFGGGPEVGLGMDYAVGSASSVSLEAGIAYVGLASVNTTHVYSPPPPGFETVIRDRTSGGMIEYLMLGFRFRQ